jgi:hypothetical protein
MAKDDPSMFGRRAMARSALLGGASVLLGGAAAARAEGPSTSQEFINARQLGAIGDGKTDDTKALQRALDAARDAHGTVFVPPGEYLTAELQMHANTGLMGVPTWEYRNPGSTVLRLATADSTCLLNITGASGVTINGLALNGAGLGKGVHGIFLNKPDYGKHEDAFRIERCQINRFSGDGVNLTRAWCFSIRQSMLGHNQGDGLRLRGWDGFIVDNWFSGNRGAGFAARDENASVTFTSNRVEWNWEENIIINGGDGYQLTGNFLDRAGTCGIALRSDRGKCSQMTITGNFLKRSGKRADPASYDSSQIFMDGARGVTCVGNNLMVWQDDSRTGAFSPSHGIVYKGLEDCVITNNAMYNGAVRQLLVDLGGHGDGLVVRDNPGRLFKIPT